MQEYKLTAEDIYNATEGGKAVILHFYPQSAAGFSGAKNFKLRADDKNPSATVYQVKNSNVWLLQDKGGSDNTAYNAVSLVMKELRLKFPQALEWIAAKFAPELLTAEERTSLEPEATWSEALPQDEMTIQIRDDGQFTQKELDVLGYHITQATCEELCLKPVDSYVTPQKNGRSSKFAANENYPMYYYDYGSYGKLYQPFSKRYRFLWKGNKEQQRKDDEEGTHIFLPLCGEKEFMQRYRDIWDGKFKGTVRVPSEDGEGEEEQDLTWKELIICSGPSDALNVKNAGYHVCWPNSETADLTEVQWRILSQMAKTVYLLYDADETGLRRMKELALRYLDINIIKLPEDLKLKRVPRTGKPCKDAKDFFMYYRKPEIQDPIRLFNELVKLSGGLKFWTAFRNKNGSYKFDINNDQLYSFLEACGFYTIDYSSAKEGYTFCQVKDNRVRLIDKEMIASECSNALLEYLRTHPQYYSQPLINSIHRSKQINSQALTKLRRIAPDFNAYTKECDYLWFRNGIFRISATGIDKIPYDQCPFMIYESKIIDHDLVPEEAFFDIGYSDEYKAKLDQLHTLTPRTPEYNTLCREIDTIEDVRRYSLTIREFGSTFMEYVYNTGRAYWRKEENNEVLTDTELKETQLNFISKCLGLGYMLSKHKNSGQPYAWYAMEMEQADEGEHLGGTGKSLLLNAVEHIRSQVYVDGQRMKEKNMQFIFQDVVRGLTDTIFIDDLNSQINLHQFMNMITGKVTIDLKHTKGFTMDFMESPKMGFSSNHAIRGFDDSLNRRIWFCAFSDYYHSDSKTRKLKLRSPRTEFGKDLIDEYTPKEMNAFYNFMLTCMMMWHKIHERVQPPMKTIIQRTLVKDMGEDFYSWAEEYFTDARLNTLVDINEAQDSFSQKISKVSQNFLTAQRFRRKLIAFCEYHGWEFNPDKVFTSDSDRKNNRIHKKVNNEDHYYFFIDTLDGRVNPDYLPAAPEGRGEAAGSEDDPPF